MLNVHNVLSRPLVIGAFAFRVSHILAGLELPLGAKPLLPSMFKTEHNAVLQHAKQVFLGWELASLKPGMSLCSWVNAPRVP